MKFLYAEKINGVAHIHFEDVNGKEHVLTCPLYMLLNDLGVTIDN